MVEAARWQTDVNLAVGRLLRKIGQKWKNSEKNKPARRVRRTTLN